MEEATVRTGVSCSASGLADHCLRLVFTIWLSVTVPAQADIIAVHDIDAGVNGSPPYLLQSITVGDYQAFADQLRTGTSQGQALVGTPISNADNLDLNSIAARNGQSNGAIETTDFGRVGLWTDTNGNAPDFFIFEAGANDSFEVQAVLPRGILGQPVRIDASAWGDT